MRISPSASALFVLVGCSEYDVSSNAPTALTVYPDIAVAPTSLAFGELRKTEQEIQGFVIENTGRAVLSVSDIAVTAGDASFTVLAESTNLLLDIGESVTVDVAFTPSTTENYGSVTVFSDDLETPEVSVDLLGYGSVPELQITPAHHQFAGTFVPCGAQVELELKNVGNEELVISQLDYTSGGLLTLDATGIELPLTLAPDAADRVLVNFEAGTEGADTGVLAVTSNDPRGVVQADQNGEGYYANTVTEAFTEPGVPPVDVMLLIDQSCSMEEDNVDDVKNGIPPFLVELQNVSDWQMIEVTGFDGCANGGIIDENTPDAAGKLINNAFIHNHHARTEALLNLASIALDRSGLDQQGNPDCNYGFLRPGALLHIIVLSDECHHVQNTETCEQDVNRQAYQTWLKAYGQYVADPSLVKVSSIVDLPDNQRCGDGSGASGYTEAATETGGAKLNICNANWGSELKDIASEILEGIRTYNLANLPIATTIAVEVNGVVTTDWIYAEANNSVTVNTPPIGEGDLVEISYSTEAECE